MAKPIDWNKILFIVLAALLLLQYFPLIPATINQPLLVSVSLVATLPVIWSALKALQKKKISIDLLAGIALIASLIAKQWASAVFINLMFASARIFGDYTKSKARAAIESLLKLRPQKVKIKQGTRIIEIDSEQVKVGDLVIIESGERLPVDGEIIQGEASIDQSSLTGESAPVEKTRGDKVFSSTLNISGSLLVKAEKIGKDTTLEKIIVLVEESQKGKSEIRTTADKFSSWYIIITLIGSILIFFVSRDAALVLSILLITSADDIAVAVPLAFFSAIGYAARRGVIIKGGNFLEGLTKVKTIIVDKTGTLTMGRLEIKNVVSFDDNKTEDVLKIAASTEFFSEHPAAKAVINYAKSKNLSFSKPNDFEEKPGKGTAAVIKGRKFFAGNLKLFKEMKILPTPSEMETIKKYENEGFNVTLIGNEKKLLGLMILADKVRPGAKETITKLRQAGIKHWVMLTGDNEKVADRVAKELDIGEFHANLLPEQKVDYVKRELAKHPLRPPAPTRNRGEQSEAGHRTAMIGDGVNDAASLALADIGIAMGAIGSDAAIESADIALMKDDISRIPEIVELGQYALKISRQDFWIWGATNFTGLLLAFSHSIGPQGAAAYNFITDFFPLLNSIRLFNLHLKIK